jgi:cell division protein FtsI/penicillin-binding protein 2
MTALALLLVAAAPLYEQSVARVLAERFANARTSYIFMDAAGGRLIDAHWEDAGRPVSVGSLVKPFTALAYGETHRFRYPEFVCRGTRSGCWLPHGHGCIGIREAIAHSCNAYFRALATRVAVRDAAALAARFGFEGPPEDSLPDALVGLGGIWKVTPESLARAYCRRVKDPRARDLVRGMALSARVGTGRAAGAGLVKTGTAPCVHRPHAPGDGFVMALYPADSPRYALLVRVHGVPGAEAALFVGRMLRVLREGK